LRKIGENGEATDKGFEFNISDDHSVNQKNYEELGEIIDQHVYELLEKEGLKRVLVPLDASKDAASFVFATQHPLEAPKKLLVLIHGSGVVRAGQWARRLIINNSLTVGTQLPYIRKARELGYEVLVTNTNHHTSKLRSPEQHINYVFEHIVTPSNAEAIAIVAHSYGGVLTVEMVQKKPRFASENPNNLSFPGR
jgi:NADPH:quinone reductase-like Zn-dependent oxidoreductase